MRERTTCLRVLSRLQEPKIASNPPKVDQDSPETEQRLLAMVAICDLFQLFGDSEEKGDKAPTILAKREGSSVQEQRRVRDEHVASQIDRAGATGTEQQGDSRTRAWGKGETLKRAFTRGVRLWVSNNCVCVCKCVCVCVFVGLCVCCLFL